MYTATKDEMPRLLSQLCLPGTFISILNATNMRTLDGLFQEFKKCLRFPEYFGNNWAAFDDCVTDLDWIDATGFVLIVEHAESLLLSDQPEITTFLRHLHVAKVYWGKPIHDDEPWDRDSMPFSCILQFDENSQEMDFVKKYSQHLCNPDLE
ncbi:MAG: barstar family protein [Planctomycetales bacterium]|nr:barstar family protein [Planctomycetales bacterium]